MVIILNKAPHVVLNMGALLVSRLFYASIFDITNKNYRHATRVAYASLSRYNIKVKIYLEQA